MKDQGIGAAVRRKEDFRFLTGVGNYTDDIDRPTQLYAYILLSCSRSRVRTQLFVSAVAGRAGSEERTAGDRTRRRRLNMLSCADWLPHDRGFVSGCLALRTSIGPGTGS